MSKSSCEKESPRLRRAERARFRNSLDVRAQLQEDQLVDEGRFLVWSTCSPSCVLLPTMKRARMIRNRSRQEDVEEHQPHGRCDKKRSEQLQELRLLVVGSQKYLHRKGDLTAIPSIVLPPPKAAGIALSSREDKHRIVEAFPSDAAMIFRESGERSN